jgi:hypothetical protein
MVVVKYKFRHNNSLKAIVEGMTFPVTIPQGFRITPEQFEQLADVEQLVRLELTARGELIVISANSFGRRYLTWVYFRLN